jgi:GLPGLI family protein
VQKPLPKYLLLLTLVLVAAACKKRPPGEMSEGKIRFRITYAQEHLGGYSTTVLPREMVMEFSDNMVRNTIEGGLGFFSLVNVSDLENDQNTTWLKFIDRKYIYEGERKEKPCCFSMLDGMVLTHTDSVKEIAGLPCRQAVASFPGNGIDPFNIWYTTEIALEDPNNNTPFSKIPGVMLEFNTLMGNANMHMIATDFTSQHIPQKHFQLPRNYRPVSKAEMESILEALMN